MELPKPSYPPDDNVLPGCLWVLAVITLVVVGLNILIYGGKYLGLWWMDLSSFATAKEGKVKSEMSHFGIGWPVVYIDSLGRERPALVTNCFGPLESKPSINLVVVNLDEDQTDTYGRKIERYTSVVHHSHQYAHGNKWKPVGE
jgi:hypothetical protein